MKSPRKTKAKIIGAYDGKSFAIVLDPVGQTVQVREHRSRKPITFPIAEFLRHAVQQRDGSLELQPTPSHA